MELVPSIPRESIIVRVVVGTTIVVTGLTLTAAYQFGALFGSSRHWPHLVVGLIVAALLARPVRHINQSLLVEGALDRLECVSVVAARSLFAASLLALSVGDWTLRAFGGATLVAAASLLAVALRRDRSRVRFLSRVYAKQDPNYRIERDDEVRGFELLPPVLSGTITDAVIAHVSATSSYRTSDGPRPLARVMSSLPKMTARMEKRRHAAATLTGIVGCFAALTLVMPLTWARSSSAKTARTQTIAAPACTDAIPYFEERLQSIAGVGRATLITHAQDATVPEGRGIVLVVPTAMNEDDAMVLADARDIPCSGRLQLEIAQPNYRAFSITASITIEHGADEATVLHDADEQVRELFQRDARTVYNEHLGFGAKEKTFGYRVRYVLRHVNGVSKVKLTVNGSEADVPLGPRDFPTLESLSLSAAR